MLGGEFFVICDHFADVDISLRQSTSVPDASSKSAFTSGDNHRAISPESTHPIPAFGSQPSRILDGVHAKPLTPKMQYVDGLSSIVDDEIVSVSGWVSLVHDRRCH
jgi:hypothetical protein